MLFLKITFGQSNCYEKHSQYKELKNNPKFRINKKHIIIHINKIIQMNYSQNESIISFVSIVDKYLQNFH